MIVGRPVVWLALLLLASLSQWSCGLVSERQSITTVRADPSSARLVPHFGFGNELVAQSTNDTNVAAALKSSSGTIARYPGGTPSDYWLWDQGWIRPGSPCNDAVGDRAYNGLQRNHPVRETTPAQWRAFLDKGGIKDSVLDLCQLTCNLTYELAGLRAHAAAGTPIKFVELGNEMYDSSRPDVLAKYPQPKDYANAMLPWITAIKAEWPGAQVALIGERWNKYKPVPREETWNEQVLHSAAGLKADAATLHIYCGWDTNANASTEANIASHLAGAATYAFSNGDNFHQQIPSHMRIWVTEMGVYPAGSLDLTWLHALFYTAMDMQLPAALPTLDVLTPYCFMCSDPTAPGFTSAEFGPVIPPSKAGTVPILRTPTGEAQSMLFGAFAKATKMTPLVFTPNPPLTAKEPRSRKLLGWELEGAKASSVVLNQGQAQVIELASIGCRITCLHAATQADVTKPGLLASELVRSSPTPAPPHSKCVVHLPAYSLCVAMQGLDSAIV